MLETGTAETSHLLLREDIAMEEKRSPTALFFLDEKYELYLRFFHLIRKNDLDGAQVVLQNGANPNWSEQKSLLSGLHISVSKSYMEMMELLLANDADVNTTDSFCRTPLMYACGAGKVEVFI